jgi:carboxyl-terminal processing protease
MKRKIEVWLPLLFSLVLTAGMYLGYELSSSQPSKGFFKKNNSSTLQEALDVIKNRYVDTVKIDTLQDYAIREMMNELDPHSVYLSAEELKQTNEDLSGNFQGIGVEFNLIRDTVNVTFVIKDGPSDKAGIKIGDKIIKVNGAPLTGKEMNTTKIRSLIRGKDGTAAALQILRDNKPLNVNVTRSDIPVSSIGAAYIAGNRIGYIKLDRFTATSYREFMEAMDSLQKQGMKELIFDLRGNGGGYMDQAVEIADEFLSGDKLIVYTQGTNSPKKEYRCKRPGVFETGTITVLVDELTASASEIVSGALQDWDRATIIGRRTFGKGLVQEVFPLSNGSALKVTVSRYYTPLGRSIQKTYAAGKKIYMDEVWNRYANGEAYFADSNKINIGKQFKTPAGRILYGGGGIMPDVFIGLDTTKSSKELNKLFYTGSFNNFVFNYFISHKNILEPYPSPMQFEKAFNPETEMWDQLIIWAKKDTINIATLPTKEKQKVEDRMEAYLARYKWRESGYYQILNTKDSVILKAIEILKK